MFDQLKYNMKYNRRNVMKNVTAWGLFGIIILVFVFWNLAPHNQSIGQGSPVAAMVNDQIIPRLKFEESVERLRRDPRFEQMQSFMPDQARQYMRSQALSQLIEVELVRQQTDKDHIWTSDAEVAQTIYDIPQFQENGKFSSEKYRGLLAANRKTPADVEDDLRNELAIRRVYNLFTAALQPMPLEVSKEAELAKMKANLEFVSLPLETLVDPKTVSADVIKAYLAKTENDATVKAYFDAHKAEFSRPEQAKVRHLLVRAEPGKEKEALAKADSLYARAQKEDLGKLASQYSDDPSSKSKAGVMDYFGRGNMVPEFEEVAFKAPVNEISRPIKTKYGYHIIQVLDRRPALNPSLDEAKPEIAQKLIAQDRSKTAVAALEDALKKGDAATVQKFAADNKLKWEDTGVFSIDSENVPKIGPNDEVVRSAFSMTAEKPLFPSLVKSGPTAFVLRYKPVPVAKTDSKPASQNETDPEVIAGRRGNDALRAWMDELKKSAKISMNQELLATSR